MTVLTQNNVAIHRGNGAATEFDYTFRVLNETHLTVQRRDYVTKIVDKTYLPSEYTVAGIGTNAGSVTLNGPALSDDYEIVITRTVPVVQEVDIVNQGGFFPEVIEEQLDLTTMALQQVREKAERSLTLPPGETGIALPSAAERAGKYIAFNASGDPYVTGGTGSNSSILSDLASTDPNKGAKMLGLYTGTAPLAYTTAQDALTGILGHGTIHATALGLVNGPNIDQFAKLRDAIAYCNDRKMTLDISGLEIRVGTQNTVDPKYLYTALRTGAVSGSFQLGETVFGDVSGASIVLDEIVEDYDQPGRRRLGGTINGTFQPGETLIGANSGATATLSALNPYAIRIPTGGWMRIVGEGTIGNLTENSGQTILFAEDADYVEIGDGVTMDGFQTVGNRPCSPVQCYGVRHFHLGRAVFRRCGVLRLGASDRDMTEVCTFTEPRFYDGMGTHCIGGKPGGCREWHGNSLYFERCRGGLNLEAEDQDGKNDDGNGNKKWPDAITANVRSVIAVDMFSDAARHDGTLDGSGYATVTIQDAESSIVEIGSIITRRADAINGIAACLLVASGQTDQPPAYVHVGSIYAEDVTQIVRYTPALRGGTVMHIGKVRGKTSPIKLRFDAATTKFVPYQWVTGGTSGATAFVVDVVQEDVGSVYEGTLTLIAVQGNFQDNETLTGSVAGSGTSDGVLRYHENTVLHLTFDGGTTAFQVGETVTGPSGSGIVVSFTTTGSSPNITGQLRLRAVEGTFNDNDVLTGDRGGSATASSDLSNGGGIGQIVIAFPSGGLDGAPGKGTITFDDVEVDSLGFVNNPPAGSKGFEIENDSAHSGNVLDVFKIDHFKCGPSKAQVAVIKDVGEVRLGSNFEYTDTINSRGGTGSSHSFFVSCERFFCDKRWYQGGGLNRISVTASVSGSITGLQIAGNDNGVGLLLDGAGDFDLVNCDIDGTADRALRVSTTVGSVSLRGVKLHGNGFYDNGSKVNVIEGGDVLQGILVADLPNPSTLQPGTQAVVTDASSPVVGSPVVDGNGTGDTAGVVATATAWHVLWADGA